MKTKRLIEGSLPGRYAGSFQFGIAVILLLALIAFVVEFVLRLKPLFSAING